MIDTAVIGAGLSGLACARALTAAGRSPIVYERSRGVGGRCATRRVQGQPVDHGAAFLHGSDEGFLAEIRGLPGVTVLDGWPRAIEGEGPPCSPKAFLPRERRLAYAEGLTAFPKYVARGLGVRLESRVEALAQGRGGVVVRTEGGATTLAASVVLAVPPPAALQLLAPLAGAGREEAAIAALLGMIGSQACLTVLAGYDPGAPRPSWDVRYPEDSTIVQMISHDSSKRAAPRFLVLVIQARPCWSRVHIEAADASWSAGIIDEAARLLGAWAGRPAWVEAHRWRFARTDRGSELSRPVAFSVRGGGQVIVTGESFAPGGGIEASWLAGSAAAARLLGEE